MIYTALTDGKDEPRTDIKCFGDYNRFNTGRMNAKIYKILSHLYDPDEWSIWVDANVFLKISEEELIGFANGHDVTVCRHPYRHNVFEEAEECKQIGLDDPAIIDEQMARYAIDKKFDPHRQGLASCFMIIRHHTERVKQMNERWWAEICRGSSRDQLSFPYVFRNINYLPLSDLKDSYYFKRVGHLKKHNSNTIDV